MKKLVCALLVLFLLCNIPCSILASESTFSIEDVATELINDALAQPNEFGLPDLNGQNIYLCNAINPYTLEEDELIPCSNIEYYIVKTDDSFVACITLCYSDGMLLSASLDVNIANVLNSACSTDDAIQIVTEGGSVYIKTESDVSNSTSSQTSRISEVDITENAISQAEGKPDVLTVKSQLSEIVTNPIVPRTSVTLYVPYVPQGEEPICWAAAAAAFGRYYTGSTYSHYTASDLVQAIGAEIGGGTMEDARKILTDIFGINTTYYSMQLSVSAAINLLQQAKPILAGFTGSYSDTGEEVSHMVVVSGFDYTSSATKFYIRDSNYAATKSVLVYSRSVAMEYYDGIVMWWDESAY